MAKMKKCKNCSTMFEPFKPMMPCCSPICAREYEFARDRAKQAKKAQEKASKLPSMPEQLAKTQKACNWYVRERDYGLPCISCGSVTGALHAGHYLGRAARPDRRFDADRNIHGQCQRCNEQYSGNRAGYRPALVERIGLAAVEALEHEDGSHQGYTIEQLMLMEQQFRDMAVTLRDLR